MYPVECYYTWEEGMDPDFNINAGEALYFGEFTIYIGLKGDTDLNEKVTADDSNEVLWFYLTLSVMGEEYYQFHENEYLQELAFYLSDVSLPMGMDQNMEAPDGFNGKYSYYANINADDSNAILWYYLYMEVLYGDLSAEEKDEMWRHEKWIESAGQDFLDEYYEAHYPNYPGQEG